MTGTCPDTRPSLLSSFGSSIWPGRVLYLVLGATPGLDACAEFEFEIFVRVLLLFYVSFQVETCRYITLRRHQMRTLPAGSIDEIVN